VRIRILYLLLLLVAAPLLAAPASSVATGRILCAYWRELPGTQIADLTQCPQFPKWPNEQVYLEQLEIPKNQEGEYGTQIRGYLHPPAGGQYVFNIAGNNQAELWLSRDEHPENVKLIACVPQWSLPRDWHANPSQTSAAVELKAGGVYYLEVRHKNGGGDNNLAVAWTLPDGTFQGPIPGSVLSPAEMIDVPAPQVQWGDLPSTPGLHEAKADVKYLNQVITMPVQIRVPAQKGSPMLVVLPEAEEIKPLPATRPTGAFGEFLEVMPRCTEERTYDQRLTIKAMAAIIADLARVYAADPKHIGIVGDHSGGAAAFKVAAQMPGFFSSLASIGGGEVRDPQLPNQLRGTHVRLLTDIREGVPTDCANRMFARLGEMQPKPEIVFLGEKELGEGTVGPWCMGQGSFYEWVLGFEKPAPAVSAPAGFWTGHRRLTLVGGLVTLGLAAILLRRLRRPA
jgi:hypothetical protein